MARDKEPTETEHVLEETPHEGVGVGGRIVITQDVVETVAGLAARQIDGIHGLGRSRLISFGRNVKRGITAEVGLKEAAVDLEVIIDYGCNIRAVAQSLRERVADEVNRMAGRKVVEVNINVVGIHHPPEEERPPERRVE